MDKILKAIVSLKAVNPKREFQGEKCWCSKFPCNGEKVKHEALCLELKELLNAYSSYMGINL